jgi:hypothetical protein
MIVYHTDMNNRHTKMLSNSMGKCPVPAVANKKGQTLADLSICNYSGTAALLLRQIKQ